MNIKNHGEWKPYRPETLPVGAPINALFARRDDGTDWYDYVNSGTNFAIDSIKLTLRDDVVAAAVIDATLLFPAGSTVLEISGVSVPDPQASLGRKVYNADAKTFRDPPPREFPNPAMDEILKRLEALEGK